MARKKYQPDRTDFLINTEWGIPQEDLSKKEAHSSGKKLFQKRWVTREEKRRLQEEHAAYSSIRNTGILLIIGSGLLLINLFFLLKSSVSAKMIWAFFELVYAVALLAAGIGLFRFVCWGRNIALFIFLSFLILPFTPLLGNDKGAPVLMIIGLTGFYYLLRRPARKIFSPAAAEEDSPPVRPGKSVLLWIVYAILALAVLFIYFTFDLHRAGKRAAAVCQSARQGTSVEDFLANLPPENYRIIQVDDRVIIVPRAGMGRHACIVFHDGQKITGSKTGFDD
ncbi:MAG: hypothetical protein M0P04_04760 [Syntrophales bacterium]|jgi:hypothetical protein|nr:hypothetical protein [Syntrophales bacterium]MDD4339947.1 hypothetical protein [Syntrophales bacterium]HOG07472.1 hypothetical protein [Syntrophales bacterium]HOS77595.1 hypothetical protein [Syntrophales bacterium]HPB70360.1 hypothetical protein [Syntrophales bacterium]